MNVMKSRWQTSLLGLATVLSLGATAGPLFMVYKTAKTSGPDRGDPFYVIVYATEIAAAFAAVLGFCLFMACVALQRRWSARAAILTGFLSAACCLLGVINYVIAQFPLVLGAAISAGLTTVVISAATLIPDRRPIDPEPG